MRYAMSCTCTRRFALVGVASVFAARVARASDNHREFIDAAFRMRDDAVRAGDQAYGAVVVKDGRIVGFGPSRVIQKKDPTAHAESEAIRDAQGKLGRDLSGAILYSSSRPCSACEQAGAEANIARMIHGRRATDAGVPRKS